MISKSRIQSLELNKPNKLNTICVYFVIAYISGIVFWEQLFADTNIFRLMFFIIILIGAIRFFIVNNKFNKDIAVLCLQFFSYYSFVLVLGIGFNNSQRFLYGIYQYIFLTLSFFATMYFLQRVDRKKIVKYIILLSSILAILAMYEYFGKTLILGTEGKFIGYLHGGDVIYRARVFSDSPLSFGTMLGCYSLISFYMYMLKKRKRYFVVFALNIIGVVATASRGPLVATLIGVCVLYILYNTFLLKSNRADEILMVIIKILLLVCAIIIFISVVANYSGDNPILQMFYSIIDWEKDTGNVTRLYKWNYYFSAFKDNWFTGIGIAATGSSNLGAGSEGVTESGVIKKLVELGLFGFILYYSIVFGIIIKGYAKLKQLTEKNKRIVILGISIASLILIEDVVVQIMESTIIAVLFWSSLALINIGCHNSINHKTDLYSGTKETLCARDKKSRRV